MATYGARFPTADTLLLEPDRHDERLFFANVFRYAGRLSLADHAYQRTRRDLLAQAELCAVAGAPRPAAERQSAARPEPLAAGGEQKRAPGAPDGAAA